MIYWAAFLHFYQPPTQYPAVLRKICNESYRPLIKLFLGLPQARVTVNMCAVLTEMLAEHGAGDILEGLKSLAQKRQLEFVESAKYHAILPLLPTEEIKRQIGLNHQTNAHFFKGVYQPRGFFPPEMCYSQEVKEAVKGMGYDWILVSGIACAHKWPLNFFAQAPCSSGSIKVIYRDDVLSNKISFRNIDSFGFIKQLVVLSKDYRDTYIVTAMDAETYGHHIRRWEKLFLKKTYEIIALLENLHGKKRLPPKSSAGLKEIRKELGQAQSLKAVTISELLEIFPTQKIRWVRPSSWSTIEADLARKNYYPLWQDKANVIHQWQWKHLKLSLQMVNFIFTLENNNKESRHFAALAREALDPALHSCQFWWANKERGMWNINLINRGLVLQEEALLNAEKAINLAPCSAELKQEFARKAAAARKMAGSIRDVLMAG